ncbi:MAG: VOC family protein [Planctomycetota bacterium]
MTQQGPWPGRFVWHDLMTTDADAAERFYTSLFDWQIEHRQMPGCVYRMIQCGPGPYRRHHARGEYPRLPLDALRGGRKRGRGSGPRHQERGQPLRAAHRHPGNRPFLRGDRSRRRVLLDLPGQSRVPGFDPNLPVPGRVCWNETYSNDADRSQAFYSEVFGWKPDSKDMGPMGFYHVQMKDGAQVGGLMQNPMPNTPSCWVVYFFAPDLVEKTQRAKELGAHAMMENMPIPNVGRFSMLTDPTGAVFALFQPDPSAVGECPA